MNRRRLVNASGYRLKVADVEYPGIQIAVPAHHIEGVMRKGMARDAVPHFDSNFKFTLFNDRFKLLRRAQITLAIGCVFEQLSIFVAIALGWRYLRIGLDDKKATLRAVQG